MEIRGPSLEPSHCHGKLEALITLWSSPKSSSKEGGPEMTLATQGNQRSRDVSCVGAEQPDVEVSS